MKKLAGIMLALIVVMVSGFGAYAEDYECSTVTIEGKYVYEVQKALDRINEIRLEACKEGVINPDDGEPLTMDDYVPIKWSADLEYIAQIRARESAISMGHARLNGESIWGIESPNGITSFGEVIAWNYTEGMIFGINQWYEEKSDWVNNTGYVTGHYTQMISPSHTYVGLASFCSEYGMFYNTTVGEYNGGYFGADEKHDTTPMAQNKSTVHTLEVLDCYLKYQVTESNKSLKVTADIVDYYGDYIQGGFGLTNADSSKITWTSSAPDKVAVQNGKITVKSCGSATITATLPNGSTASTQVTYKHNYKTETVNPTCAKEGKETKTCTVCGKTETKVLAKTNTHTYKTETVNPTCVKDGKETKTCTVCGKTETKVLAKTNTHTYKTETVNPTCVKDGKETKTCTVCGKTETKVLAKTNAHTFGSWKVTLKPTTTSTGEQTRECSVCGKVETVIIDKLTADEPIKDDSSTDDSSSDDSSNDDSSTDDSSTDDSSSDDSSTDDSSSDDSSTDDISVDDSSTDDSSTDDSSSDDSSVDDSSSDDSSVDDSSVDDSSSDDSSVVDDSSVNSSEDVSADEQSTVDQSDNEQTSQADSSSIDFSPMLFIIIAAVAGVIVIVTIIIIIVKKKR